MNKRIANAPAKTISAAEAAKLVESGMTLDYGGLSLQPDVFDKALAARASELRGVKVRAVLSTRAVAILEVDPEGKSFEYYNWHFGGYDRVKHDARRTVYIPLNLGEVPDYYRRFLAPTDIVIIRAAPMDEHGMFNFGPTCAWLRATIERAKMVIVEVSPGIPYVYGPANGVHISEIDYLIEGSNIGLAELPHSAMSDIDRAVARQLASEIEDGACIQIGIGAMPNAACSLLAESGIKNLGVHTEMLTDGIIDLVKAGCVTGARKQLNPGKVVFTFAFGSKYMYDAITRNPEMEIHPVEYTNLPHIIMQNDNAVSINNTTQMDLQGQACSESDGHRHLTGTGGQLQFVRGAYASKGGKSFMLLSSTYEKKGQRKSRIVLNLTPGNIVTTPRSDTMYVVTEYGMTNLKGKSVSERAQALIGLAHPDFREGLEREAHENGLLPRWVAVGSL
ncbi:MAG: acetyl-CoA hydrolase/transferase C-terminal domain-containing protein [Alphaproteobacteria bacterium]|nr:acetyl-CoA hydrolase/transferase C-terminal domain-containing protein [Alphaproteobacteria bacterium]